MAEILKAGDGEATAEEEPDAVFAEEYEPASMKDEAKMLENMDFAIQELGEVATKVQDLVNFVNPYCGTEVNESGDQPKFKVGDVVRVMGVSGMDFYGRDAPIGSIVKIEPPHPDVGVYEYMIKGRSGEFFAYEDELELVPERFTEEENDFMEKPARYGIGDHVLYKGEECVVTDVDEDLRNDEEIYQVSKDSDKVDGLNFNDWATCDELEPLEEFTEGIGKFNFHVGDKVKVVGRGLASKGWIGVVSSVDKSSPGLPYTVDFEGRESGEYAPDELAPAKGFTEEENSKMKKIAKERGADDVWLSEDDIIGMKVSGESSTDETSINLTEDEVSELEDAVQDYIMEAEAEDGSASDLVVGVAASRALKWIEWKTGKAVRRLNPEKVVMNWAEGDDGDGRAVANGNSQTVYDFVEEMYKGVSDYYLESDEEFMEDGGQQLKNKLNKGDDGWTTIGQPVFEARVVVDANDVWDVLELLDNDIANKELTDLINSHVRSEEEIMDAIDELCGETITKKELNTLLSGRMETLVDYLGLDVERYKDTGEFVDSDKPTSVELENTDEQKPEEVKSQDKTFNTDGENKTLVAGEDNKKPVCEMTIEQEVDDPWKLSEMLWGQGKENLQELLRSGVVDEDAIMQILEDMEIRNLTSINDAFAYDFESMLEAFGCDPEAWSRELKIVKLGDYDNDHEDEESVDESKKKGASDPEA